MPAMLGNGNATRKGNWGMGAQEVIVSLSVNQLTLTCYAFF